MTVDIRAKVVCDLGEVISGGWSDDHVQGTGLIRTRGELVIKGVHRFSLGQQVQLAYVQNGTASRFPRSLRVLSAFADPFRRQTTIQLGCLLTLKENLKPSLVEDETVKSWNDPANSNVVCTAFIEGTIGVSAHYVASQCLEHLGIVAESIPLTNWYAVEEFDLTPGYVAVLSDLLVSESYVGYLDAGETLRIADLSTFNSTMVYIDETQIIDVSSINSGEIPGDSVTAQYNYKRFKQPEALDEDEQKKRDWERDETVGPPNTYVVNYAGGVYTVSHSPSTVVETTYDVLDRAIKRVETTTTHTADINPSYIKWYLENPGSFFNVGTVSRVTVSDFIYEYTAEQLRLPDEPPPPGTCSQYFGVARPIYDPDRDNQIINEIHVTTVSEMEIAGTLNLAYSGQYQTPAGGSSEYEYHPGSLASTVSEVVTVAYEKDTESGITKTITQRFQARAFAPSGNQVGAAEAETAAELTGNIAAVVGNATVLLNMGAQIATRTDRLYGVQRRPSQEERNNEALLKTAVEDVSEFSFVYGTESSENVVVYSVPYVSDDRITYLGELGGQSIFDVEPSDAPTVAARYAIAQHTLAFGHRNGFSLQLAAPNMPTYALDRLTVTAAGFACAFIANGISWSFDSNGVVCNVDAVCIGGVGETEIGGSLWFPVQPGLTLLGPAPAVYQNEYPEPANSMPIDEETFNPVVLPLTFWDDLPTNTPAIPKQEITVPAVVPMWKQIATYTFKARTTINVVRTYPQIPIQQPVLLRTKTAISVFNLNVREITFAVKTASNVEATAPAIRDHPIEMFAVLGFSTTIFK